MLTGAGWAGQPGSKAVGRASILPFFEGVYAPCGDAKWEAYLTNFEPEFRLPLFQTVFHDSVIATHHWSFASLKTKDCAKTVELLELLYQVPPLYHLNLAEFQKRKPQLKRHYDFFSPLHRETALLPLADFQWLTPDGTVRRATFGDNACTPPALLLPSPRMDQFPVWRPITTESES